MLIQLDKYREIEIPESEIFIAYVVEYGLFEQPKILSKHKTQESAIKAGIRNSGAWKFIILDNVAYRPEAFIKIKTWN